MIKLVVGEIYLYNYVKQLPSLIQESDRTIDDNSYSSDYEFIEEKNEMFHFYDWSRGVDVYLTSEELESHIK